MEILLGFVSSLSRPIHSALDRMKFPQVFKRKSKGVEVGPMISCSTASAANKLYNSTCFVYVLLIGIRETGLIWPVFGRLSVSLFLLPINVVCNVNAPYFSNAHQRDRGTHYTSII